MKLILTALDGSKHAQRVLDGAVDLARRTGAKLLLAHVVTIPVELPAEAYAIEPDGVEQLLIRLATKQLDQLCAAVPPALLDGKRVVSGVPWRVICELATKEKVDLIAIGSHGYRGLDRLLGTTAAKVVNHADRSVLVIRAVELLDELLDGK